MEKRVGVYMNKKGFTLIELIVVVVIIGAILLFALPNITSTLERNKKDEMINDAKDAIEKAKNYLLTHKGEYPENGEKFFNLKTIDPSGDIISTPYGDDYCRVDSRVYVSFYENKYVYYVELVSPSVKLAKSDLDTLNSKDKYIQIQENTSSCSPVT